MIGSSFGAAIFGSLFASFLANPGRSGVGRRWRPPTNTVSTGAAPAAAGRMARAGDDRPMPDALGRVFLFAAPVALVGFVSR